MVTTKIRAFLAVAIPSELRERLAALQSSLGDILPPIRWVPPEAMHLTLAFLGSIDASRVDEIREALSSFVQQMQCFEIRLQGIGVFPNLVVPRVLWVGVGEGRDRLIRQARDLDTALEPLGFARSEVAYEPHLTLARIRTRREHIGRALGESGWIDGSRDFGSLGIECITLFESRSGPDGQIYRPLAQFRLGDSEPPD